MKRNRFGMRAGAAAAVAGILLLLGAAPVWASDSPRPRVAFDRPGGFTVQQGDEATVTATLVGGSGGMWFSWEGNNAGTATGDGGVTFVIDTGVPGEYWLRAVGGSDGTDGDYAGKIRFRVAAAGAVAQGARAAGEGETVLLSEDFSGLTSGASTELTSWNGWKGSKMFNGTNCLKVGSSKTSGEAISPSAALEGCTGRVEFSLRKYGSDNTTVGLSRSLDGGDTWSEALATYGNLSDTSTLYSVDLEAAQSLKLKWSGTGKRFHLDDVAVYKKEGSREPAAPELDLEPADTAVTLYVGQSYSLTATATDYDGDTISLSAAGLPDGSTWETDGPGTRSVEGRFAWTPETTGTWTVVFAAADKDGTNTASVEFTVEPEGQGRISFASDTVFATEDSGIAYLTVVRTGGSLGQIGAWWHTADGTAVAGSDYTAKEKGVVMFVPGDLTPKTLTVLLKPDSEVEPNESFTVSLSLIEGSTGEVGEPSTCTVTIVDDDDTDAAYYAGCYENGALKTGSDLKDALSKIINTGVTTNLYRGSLDDILRVTDANSTNGSGNLVRCIYLQEDITLFNKEHLWAQSHGIDERDPAYGDLHHIRACDITMNSKRGNLDFDNCQGKSGAVEYNGCYYISNKAWEPPDAAKGDVARALLYMDVRYEDKYNSQMQLELVDFVGTSADSNQMGRLSTLLEWNELDPPDDFERRRNELIYTTYQHNRNPFIDHPTWARAVFDPGNFQEEALTWTVSVTAEGSGRVNNQAGSFAATVTNGLKAMFDVVPDSHWHIGSITWNGALVPQASYTNAASYSYTTPAVLGSSMLVVVFVPETAALGTPLWWLAQYGADKPSVAGGDWDTAELEDWNDDGIPNWREYLAGNDPTAFALRQVSGVAVSGETAEGFAVGWEGVEGAGSYRVRVCETAWVAAASAEFEEGAVDEGWLLSDSGAELSKGSPAALSGSWGLTLYGAGAWLLSPEVTDPEAVEFRYRRSSGNGSPWALVVQVSEDGGGRWTDAATLTDVAWEVRTNRTDLSAWYGKTVRVRLLDMRPVGGSAWRYVDAVTVWAGGAVAAEGTTGGTSWTVAGLSGGTGYDVRVRGEATTPADAVGLWSAPVRATTLAASEKSAYELWLEGMGLDVEDYPESAVADGDGDGMSNWAEFVAGTDPSEKTNVFAISVGAMVGGTLRLEANPVLPDRDYSVVYWTNLLAPPRTNVLGNGFQSLSIETNVPAAWFGTIRVGLP